jgi:uncharacterized protein (DUF58 family)
VASLSRTIVDVLGRARTPAEPGPGAITSESLQALDAAIGRRVTGLLAGDYRSEFAGVGSELHQVRPYQPGDDVRRIDWNVTARTGIPHVRVDLAERVLTSWLVIDSSASMSFGTADRRKADVAEGVAIAVGHVATRRGNRLGVVAYGSGKPHFRLPREGRRELLLALSVLRESPAGAGGLREALELVGGLAVQRALVVVVSDFRGPRDWHRDLAHVAARHSTLAIEVRDPREQALADIGELHLRDPETGRQVLVDTEDEVVREWFAQAAADERLEVLRLLASAGVPHVALSTHGDWLRHLAMFLGRGARA